MRGRRAEREPDANLDFQAVLAVWAHTLVVKVVISVISVSTTLILDERKPGRVISRCVEIAHEDTHSLLDGVRGIGISQRTRRPKL